METGLLETKLLDYSHPLIQACIAEQGWVGLNEKEQIRLIYNFVRDSVQFGYNLQDDLPASHVLQDGYGQCNTKGTLFMALLRGVGIPCRIHGFTIDKKLQKGAVTGIFYLLSPREILHSWVEVYFEGRWMNLEGFILDVPYLTQLQRRFKDCKDDFCGYGVATDRFQSPAIYWEGNDTYIQKEGIVRDLGVYDSPDAFYAKHQQRLGPMKELLYKYGVRHVMNRNVQRIRQAR